MAEAAMTNILYSNHLKRRRGSAHCRTQRRMLMKFRGSIELMFALNSMLVACGVPVMETVANNTKWLFGESETRLTPRSLSVISETEKLVSVPFTLLKLQNSKGYTILGRMLSREHHIRFGSASAVEYRGAHRGLI